MGKKGKQERVELFGRIEVSEKELPYGEVEVAVVTPQKSRNRRQYNIDGIDIKNYKKNPVVLWGHDYEGLPIATSKKIWKENGKLMSITKFATGLYEFADTVYRLVKNGFINTVSIGGLATDSEFREDKDGGFEYVNALEMLEYSYVPVPGIANALVQKNGVSREEFKKQYQEFTYKGLRKKLELLDGDELNTQIKALKSLTSALESVYSESSQDTESTEEPTKAKRTKLITVRNSAKQVDKQAELIISQINSKINSLKKQNEE